MEYREQFPTTTDHPAWEAGNWQLKHVGFSREQIARLFRVKALYQRGDYHEANPEQMRLAFVRWLYLQGRLQS
jgi:hypothetical protein